MEVTPLLCTSSSVAQVAHEQPALTTIPKSNVRLVRQRKTITRHTTVAKLPLNAGVRLSDIQIGLISWINYGKYKGLSSATLATRKLVIGKLVWWLQETQLAYCDQKAIMGWVAYLRPSHHAGRWGNEEQTRAARPQTVVTYFSIVRGFFNYMLKDGMIEKSPCDGLEPPKANQDQIKPFTDADVSALLRSAKQTKTFHRDTAIVALLCETGIRVSELVNLTRRDLDLAQHQVTVLGKGNKRRTVPFGLETKQALTKLVIQERPDNDMNIFISSAGKEAGKPMTRSGIYQLLQELGKAAGIEGVRCSPHTCRHYAAVTYISEGADAFFVQSLLGHTTPRQTARYVNLGQAAMAEKARKHSPLDNLKRKNRQNLGG